MEIRSIGNLRVSSGVARAEGQLALGNVALALEGFRNGLREQPKDLRALVGIAICYDRMGRFDLSRRWYETALAIAPKDAVVLTRMAESLDLQGRSSEAAAIRAETAASAQPLATSTAVRLLQNAADDVQLAAAGSSVTVKLPPPLPAPVDSQRELNGKAHQPRLERLSLGEVALLTTTEPVWTAELIHKEPQRVTFRFVAVDRGTRLLNAARSQGLAARTRDRLSNAGWSRLAIGDAPVPHEHTLILYPAALADRAKHLAATLGFGRLQPSIAGQITVLLGRDAVSPRSDRRA
jgi:hypothetical protein